MQDSFQKLSLDEESILDRFTGNILLGKLLATRKIRRFMMAEEVTRIWLLRGTIKVVALAENTFKFIFSDIKDRGDFEALALVF